MDQPPVEPQATPPQCRWQPLGAIDRRVIGVLAEKAKTTPDVYPMSLNAIAAGCNQKSNRAPIMQLEPADVEESLDRLRGLGAVGLVEGYGRVQKYRHYLYDWLGVNKVELAVMTELLLRGDQTVGELRGRAARMEPIADLAALQPVVNSLKAKRLVMALTPDRRRHVVSHALYKPREIEALKAKYQGQSVRAAAPGCARSADTAGGGCATRGIGNRLRDPPRTGRCPRRSRAVAPRLRRTPWRPSALDRRRADASRRSRRVRIPAPALWGSETNPTFPCPKPASARERGSCGHPRRSACR